jgi:hypothetical protein
VSNTPTPRDFPVLRTVQRHHQIFRGTRPCVSCPCCHLAVDPRNARRHWQACQRRKRQAPALWAEWKKDMIEWSKEAS